MKGEPYKRWLVRPTGTLNLEVGDRNSRMGFVVDYQEL